jgi:hypothetical protein
MNPILHIDDSAFDDPQAVRREVLNGEFADVISPVDGISYPGICALIHWDVSQAFAAKIKEKMGVNISVCYMFARAMVEGKKAPHKVHSDKIMGDYSAHVYLSRWWPREAGTSFWKHESEGQIHTDKTDLSKIDLTELDRWTQYEFVPGKFNRLLIHHADFWHMAEPHEGWGDTPESGRLVLTCFFKVQ